jgi:hypothetical protein
MLGRASISAIVTAIFVTLCAPADAGYGSGCCAGFYSDACRPFVRQVRVYYGRPFYGARFCGGVYYGACWRWQFTPWGWQLMRVCGGGYGYPFAY